MAKSPVAGVHSQPLTWGETIFGAPQKIQQLYNFEPEQWQAIAQLLSQGRQGLGGLAPQYQKFAKEAGREIEFPSYDKQYKQFLGPLGETLYPEELEALQRAQGRFGRGLQDPFHGPAAFELYNQLQQQRDIGMQPGQGFEPIAQEAIRKFQTQIAPSIAERFEAVGGSNQRSSGLEGALYGAGAQLGGQLGALGSQYAVEQQRLGQTQQGLQQQTLQQLQNLLTSQQHEALERAGLGLRGLGERRGLLESQQQQQLQGLGTGLQALQGRGELGARQAALGLRKRTAIKCSGKSTKSLYKSIKRWIAT